MFKAHCAYTFIADFRGGGGGLFVERVADVFIQSIWHTCIWLVNIPNVLFTWNAFVAIYLP